MWISTASVSAVGNVSKRATVPTPVLPCRMLPRHFSRFAFEVRCHAQPGFPNRRVSSTFREFAIPGGKLP